MDLQSKTNEFLTAELTQRFAKLTEWLVTNKNTSVTVDELLAEFNNTTTVSRPSLPTIEVPKTVPGNVVMPTTLKKKKASAKASPAATSPPQVSNSIPSGEGCKVLGTRGDKKGKPCGAPVVPGTDACKACSAKQKKAAAKASAKPPAFAAAPDDTPVEQDYEPYPMEGRDNVIKLNPQGYVVVQHDENVVCYGIHDSNGLRDLNDAEKQDAAKLMVVAPEGVAGLTKPSAPKLEPKPKTPEPVKIPVPEPVKAPEPTPEPVKVPENTQEPVKAPEPTPEPVKVPVPEPVKVPEPTPELVKAPEPVKVTEPTPELVKAPEPAPVAKAEKKRTKKEDEVKPATAEPTKAPVPKSIIPPTMKPPPTIGLPANILGGVKLPGLKIAGK